AQSSYIREKPMQNGDFPSHMIKVREGNNETVHYFLTNDALDQFKTAHAELFGGDTEIERRKDGPVRRATVADLHHESKAVAELIGKLSRKGLSVEHYAGQDKPLFELVEGEVDKATVTPLFSIPDILSGIKAVGKRGIQ